MVNPVLSYFEHTPMMKCFKTDINYKYLHSDNCAATTFVYRTQPVIHIRRDVKMCKKKLKIVRMLFINGEVPSVKIDHDIKVYPVCYQK